MLPKLNTSIVTYGLYMRQIGKKSNLYRGWSNIGDKIYPVYYSKGSGDGYYKPLHWVLVQGKKGFYFRVTQAQKLSLGELSIQTDSRGLRVWKGEVLLTTLSFKHLEEPIEEKGKYYKFRKRLTSVPITKFPEYKLLTKHERRVLLQAYDVHFGKRVRKKIYKSQQRSKKPKP